MSELTNWTTVAESQYSWERDALEFMRSRFPAHEPYQAWSNFEFIAADGSINEVDVLVFSRQGLFLIEIKSRPGRLSGDAGTWTWKTDGKLVTIDNPLIATNTKAKKLRSLLERQKVFRNNVRLPFIEALVFCSATDLRVDLQGMGGHRVCFRDREPHKDASSRPGIMAAIKERKCPGLEGQPKGTHDRRMAKIVSQAMDQAGIRPSQRHRKVSDYRLEQLIGEGPGYQDWRATHAQLKAAKRRVRLYLVQAEATEEDRQVNERAALREFQLLESLHHPGILRAHGFTEHELGPALIFEEHPGSMRLDHFLAQRGDRLAVDQRLHLLRQIAEVMRFAHDKKVVHRALCPQSILVENPDSEHPHIKVFNWQVGYRSAGSTTGGAREVSATSHVDRLVEDASTAYMAPEATADGGSIGEHLDVFSLGAIAYHVFAGEAPAANGLDLSNELRETKGLRISSVLNGAGENLQFLIQYATHPDVSNRIDSVADFQGYLDDVEEELTAPEYDFVEDPTRAQKGDVLPGQLTVLKRLGQGACSIALLVEGDDGIKYVLKAANDPENNGRLKDEAEVLQKLRHSYIVEYVRWTEIGDRSGFLIRPVLVGKDEQRVETLGQRLRKEGRLHIDLLQRFGEDLLGVLNYLQEQGIPHRDIKPDNIAVGQVGYGDRLHLVLFDFSLSRAPVENIRAGTPGYLDPLLPLRDPPRWDLHAERYAAAATLYELATGTLPKWGDGATDPSHLDCEVTVDAELFDASLRDGLTEFFRTAFRRESSQRFDNAEEMLRAWRRCFEGIEEPGALTDNEDEGQLHALLAEATFDTQIPELGLGTRAVNVLDRTNVLTVEDLLTIPLRRLQRLRGVGNKTRREIATVVRLLRERLGTPQHRNVVAPDVATESKPETHEFGKPSVDSLAQRITQTAPSDGETVRQTLDGLLGLDDQVLGRWPSQTEVSERIGVTRGRVNQIVGKFQTRWSRDPAMTSLRAEIAEILDTSGGLMSNAELCEAILVARGSVQDDPQRTQLAAAVARAAVEVERTMTDPRFLVRREVDRVIVARDQDRASYASRLGAMADRLADEDPLAPPARVIQRLREVTTPAEASVLSDRRLIRLAAGVSQHAAVSSRQELYPRGMDAARALKLSQGALYGLPYLSVPQIRERVSSRYPDAQELPDRPTLDALLLEAGFKWDPTARGTGCYVSQLPDSVSVSAASESVSRQGTAMGRAEGEMITPEIADARQFEERLWRGIKDGSFLTLLIHPKYYQRASEELTARFPIELVDFEGLFLDALRQVVDKAGAKWEAVIQADSTPGGERWNKFLVLVKRAMPLVEQQLEALKKPVLLVYAGLLARYDRMDLLDQLREKIGRRDGIPSLWLLVAGDQQAMLDGKAVPILGPGQRAQIPLSWIKNHHRANGSVDRE